MRITITDSYEYDAFGNSFTVSGSTPNNYLYRGEQYDPDLGLYYLRARYYNPLTGRFMSRDPEDGKHSDVSSLHKYLYAEGDPVNAIDPTGRDTIETIFTTTDISSPLEIRAELVARSVAEIFCVAAGLLKASVATIPVGIPLPGGIPRLSFTAIVALCQRLAF